MTEADAKSTRATNAESTRARDRAQYFREYHRKRRKRSDVKAAIRAKYERDYAIEAWWRACYKLSHGCVDCGYCEHPAALEFDHLLPEHKTGNIASMRSIKAMKAEIERCAIEVRCSNCHRIRTFEEQNGREARAKRDANDNANDKC